MANEQSGSPLRRWRPFYGAFGAIDDAIEKAGGHSRGAFRDVRVRILQLLRGATDDGVAEQLCGALDDAMVEALETLRVAPVPHGLLASTDLARTIDALGNHGSARIRRLAGDVVRGWRAANVATTTAVKEEQFDKLSADDLIPHQGISAVIADGNARGHKEKLHIQPAKMLPAAEIKLHIPPAKKMFPTVPAAEAQKKKVYVPPAKMLPTTATVSTPNMSETKKPTVDESKKMEATKRKLCEGYEEAKKIKRKHTIQKINDKEAAKMFEQKQRKMHPVIRGRGPAACRTSSGVRRSLLYSLQMI
ncbi:probable mediator of RNA polymerase II transcription subunit 26c [Miscanthus floridulus]|uniref:probable mediator of RNA polymerase II transcription subunit 26c n=1 Tax=Miscanthus floridulus TaxID=154761 RepID=UPI0034591EC2